MSAMRMKQRVNGRRAEDREIETIYREYCAGMQINIMRIGDLFEMARKLLQHSAPRSEIGNAMIDFIKMQGVLL